MGLYIITQYYVQTKLFGEYLGDAVGRGLVNPKGL